MHWGQVLGLSGNFKHSSFSAPLRLAWELSLILLGQMCAVQHLFQWQESSPERQSGPQSSSHCRVTEWGINKRTPARHFETSKLKVSQSFISIEPTAAAHTFFKVLKVCLPRNLRLRARSRNGANAPSHFSVRASLFLEERRAFSLNRAQATESSCRWMNRQSLYFTAPLLFWSHSNYTKHGRYLVKLDKVKRFNNNYVVCVRYW